MKKRLVVAILLICVGIGFWLFRWESSVIKSQPEPKEGARTNSSETGGTAEKRTTVGGPSAAAPVPIKVAVSDAQREAMRSPINFYGRVVDESEQPIEGATVTGGIAWSDSAPSNTKELQTTSDQAGRFSFVNEVGITLVVQVSKPGYRAILGRSNLRLDYFDGRTRLSPTSAERPAVLMLKRVPLAETVNHMESSGSIVAESESEDIAFSLRSGRRVKGGAGDIQVLLRADYSKNSARRYPWSMRILVPGGGLVERRDASENVAPEAGYTESDEFRVDPTGGPWVPYWERTYFAKLADGTFAKFTLSASAGSKLFCSISNAVHNPVTSSRNLEYDPAIAVSPK